METRKLTSSDSFSIFQQTAEIHSQEIHFGLLPLLGKNFLAQLNLEITRAPRSGVWAVIEGGRVLGFVSGCADLDEVYRFILLHSVFRLLWKAGMAFFSPRFLIKISAVIFYPFQHHDEEKTTSDSEPPEHNEGSAELLAIAVRPENQGQGIGKLLIKALEDGLREYGLTGSYFVATNIEEVGSNAFYRSQGFLPWGTQRHHDLILQVYRKHL